MQKSKNTLENHQAETRAENNSDHSLQFSLRLSKSRCETVIGRSWGKSVKKTKKTLTPTP